MITLETQAILAFLQVMMNGMICSDIWYKYHECDISKLLYVISRAVRRLKFETILKYYECYLCQISATNHAIICLYYYRNVREYHLIFERSNLNAKKKTQLWPKQTSVVTTAGVPVVTFSAWVVVGRVGVAVVLVISTIGGGKVAVWFNGGCWGIGPKHFQR